MGLRLGLVQYMNYLEASVNSRTVSEGEEVFNAGHLILCGKTEATATHIKICALCLQTSALNSNPHEINGLLEITDNKKVLIKKMNCSCKAGNSGRCKHISAVLIKCTREDLNDLEDISKTDLRCVWTSEKTNTKKKYTAVPIKDMPCIQVKKNQAKNEFSENVDGMLEYFIQSLPNSAISKHRSGRRQEVAEEGTQNTSIINPDTNIVGNFFLLILTNSRQSVLMTELSSTNIVFENDCCKNLYCKLFNEDPYVVILALQNSKDWHEFRKYRVTGSRCYELFTYSNDNWESKAMKYFWPKTFTNKFVRHGQKYERRARQLFILASGKEVFECGMVISQSNKWLGYSPDGIILEKGQPIALLEIKCLYSGATATIVEALKSCHYVVLNNGVYSLKKKHKYYGQIQLGMALLSLEKCFLLVYASFDESFLIVEVEYDYDFAKKMLTTVKTNFFHKMWHTLCKEQVLL